ncbi:MAG: M23 family metallopeptidase [Bacteroidales bacterium]|nr:M23 family metallopeptidase [Bacteroidales bacterium]
MKRRKIYSILLRDEARLEDVASVELNYWKIAGYFLILLVFSVCSGAALVMLTPLHELLPGYMKQDARLATEEAMMRLDSLQQETERNRIFIANMLETLSPAHLSDSISDIRRDIVSYEDSLLQPSRAERDFVRKMQEKEKYDISVVAPQAAGDMMFFPVSSESVLSESSLNQRVARILLPLGAPVCAIADGTVIAVYRNGTMNQYAVIVQHPQGFISRYSQVSAPFVDQGEVVTGGQAIARTSASLSEGIKLEMWHNGTPLIPFSYLGHIAPEKDRTSETRISAGAK